MSTVGIKYLFHNHRIEKPRFRLKSVVKNQSSLNYSLKPLRSGGSFCNFKYPLGVRPLRAASSNTEILETKDVFFKETFILKRIEAVCNLANFLCSFFEIYFNFSDFESYWSLFGCFENTEK